MLIFFFLWKLLQVYLLEINLVHFINTEKYTEHYLYKYTTIMIFAIQNSWNSVSAIFGFWYTKHKPALPLGSGVKIELIHHSLSLLYHQFSFSPAVTCYIRSIKCLNVMQHPINMPFPPSKLNLSGLDTNSFILCSRCLQLNMGQLFTLFSLNLITIIINDKCFICLNHLLESTRKQSISERGRERKTKLKKKFKPWEVFHFPPQLPLPQ